MKQELSALLQQAVEAAFAAGHLRPTGLPPVELETPKIATHGDFSTNVAMTMAASQKRAPQEIAGIILDHIEDPDHLLSKTEVAGPGFINFFIAREKWYEVLKAVHKKDTAYGTSQVGLGKRIQIEFVSANPTGPLHVGHGRCAAVGDTLAAILKAVGYEVEKEYYVNDSGRQIYTLGRSVFLRYCQLLGNTIDFPADCYQGEYIQDLARMLIDREGERLLDMPEEEAVMICAKFAADEILAGIRQDLETFGVSLDQWFSEQSLYDSGAVEAVIQDLKSQDIIYEHDGALWFRTTDFGDEKDRVVVRANGTTTYFAPDIAYHKDKFERKFDCIINIWGADHHGYVPRISASIQAMGYDKAQCRIVLVQLVNLLRGGKPVAMSTRAGEFVTLKEVVDEVGRDAARFLFLWRHHESPLDFDLELAKQQSNENPVYYVQYVHARISNILRKAAERGYKEIDWHDDFHEILTLPEEIQLIKLMSRYPEVVALSARLMEPHRVPFYLKELAAAFHAYYHDRNKHKVVSDDAKLSAARLYLVSAIRIIIRNGLTLMGVSAPDIM
ncbi:MAG: arginine--tRNA ligase [Deltaproteobacteria bacterium]|nr:arginine--tRNA ligase [Deltaproteobacteria bacterium]MBW2018761.1 arginine--tRNA ligase [Deltaproteobacteria bacterium]MBW2073490.1 arginine--tRNA ligase [Deltaproteobacteria bacterium]RLB83006.1 MAG: arginine--tRNA ligase [Deltaproteobacteria bacterium]